MNNPSSLWPENHKNPETANEILTARRMKTSACLSIIFVSYSNEPIAAIMQPNTARPAKERTPECPATSKVENWSVPAAQARMRANPAPISRMPIRTDIVRAALS